MPDSLSKESAFYWEFKVEVMIQQTTKTLFLYFLIDELEACKFCVLVWKIKTKNKYTIFHHNKPIDSICSNMI